MVLAEASKVVFLPSIFANTVSIHFKISTDTRSLFPEKSTSFWSWVREKSLISVIQKVPE